MQYGGTMKGVASWGYIVIALEGDVVALQEFKDQVAKLRFMLDTPPEDLKAIIDFNAPTGVYGHSMGGASTLNAASDAESVKNAKIAAAVAMHPGIQLGSLVPHVPTLYFTGDIDPLCGPLVTKPQYDLAAVEGLTRGYVVMHGYDHLHPMGPKSNGEVDGIAAWFDCFVKKDAQKCDTIFQHQKDTPDCSKTFPSTPTSHCEVHLGKNHTEILEKSALVGQPQGPGAGPWKMSTPEEHGLSTDALKAADRYIGAHALVRKCLTVVKDGEIVYEAGDCKSTTQGFSMTKTLGALVVGLAVGQGKLDVTADITKTYGVKSPKKYAVTSEEIMSQKIAGSEPGQKFFYDALGTMWINHLAEVVRKATGKSSHELWHEGLYTPLGLSSSFKWLLGDEWGAGAEGSCRDWARVGQLLLNKGAWPGSNGSPQQLVPEDYIVNMTRPHTFKGYADPNTCYGYLTWLNKGSRPGHCVGDIGPYIPLPKGTPNDVFFMAGFTGEVTMIIPSHNTVVVSLGTSAAVGTMVAPVLYKAFCENNVFGDNCPKQLEEVLV